MSQPLKAIFFDIDGTLFSTSEFALQARKASAEAMVNAGVDMQPDELLQELTEVIREFTTNFDRHFDKLLMRIPKRVYKGYNPCMIVAAGVVAYHETKSKLLEPYEDATEVLKRLAKTDLVRGIITEGLEIKQAEKLVRLNLQTYFTPNAIFISHQLGISKPNPKLYLRACSDLNLKPSECMYVGDNPITDIDPANGIGMITVRLLRDGKFRKAQGKTKAKHDIQNYWDLLEILRSDHKIDIQEILE